MAVQTSPREMGETVTRMTKDGRKLTYHLTVIQQPERARACGSGAKSSADRRPVDPPPVVELRIFEGDAKNDVTFSHNANFFLFATLESARPIIHGRVQPASQQTPVLTGMPVSGMAYLDRPSEAGYFIFPDLSVRHEGKYRLSFNLYEETKDAKDSDVEQLAEGQAKSPPTVPTPNGSFDWRLEVKSVPFTVYSAKKFPGLTESTILSRTVAEQGCRVRIRRDVRMRRRDGKSGGDFDEFEEEYSRSRRTATPDSVHDAYARQRSLSNSSADRHAYVQESQRRSSGADFPQQPYSSNYGPAPIPPQSGSGGYLTFGGSSAQHYQTPQFPQSAATSQPIPSQPPFQSAQAAYNQPPPPPSNYRQSSNAATFPYPDRQSYSHQYASHRENYDGDYRRPTAAYPPTSASQASQYPPTEQNYTRNGPLPSYQQYPPRARTPVGQSPVSLAPLKMPPIESKYDTLAGPGAIASASRLAPPLPSPSYQERPPSLGHYQTSGPTQAAPEPPRNHKRPYDSVFSTSSAHQPLHNGMRPSSSHCAQGSTNAIDDDNETASIEALRMQYKRADGTSYSRELPAFE